MTNSLPDTTDQMYHLLRDKPWFRCIGYGRNPPKIYLYIDNKLSKTETLWIWINHCFPFCLTYPVEIKQIGAIEPVEA